MQAFLEQVGKGLVDHPDAVDITEVEQERTTVYELRLDPTDVGRIIGKSGADHQRHPFPDAGWQCQGGQVYPAGSDRREGRRRGRVSRRHPALMAGEDFLGSHEN